MRPLVTLHRKCGHGLGGELEFGVGGGGAAFASLGGFEFAPGAFGGAVAMADVVGECVAEGVPVEVVGVFADELVERADQVADPVAACVGGAVALGRPRRAQPRPCLGRRLSGPFSSKLITTPFFGWCR